MAHVVYGIDVGASSVKAAVIEAGFRHTHLVEVFEEPVPVGPEPLAERQGTALATVRARLSSEATVYAAMPGDLLSVRLLDLPFSEARKIEQVLGYELEGQIVHALEDVVYDHVVVPGGEESTHVLAVAARRDDIAATLALMAGAGIEPRSLYPAPVIYRANPPAVLAPGAADAAEPGPEGEPTVVEEAAGCRVLLDLGAERTNVAFLRGGDVIYARTLVRGGRQLTEALAKAFSVSPEQAEAGKRQGGFVSSAAEPLPSTATASHARVDQTLREALGPLLRDLLQTLASFRASSKDPVGAVLLCGGGARLVGLGAYLSEALGLPVAPLPTPGFDAAGVPVDPSYALAVAVAWAGARGRKEIDLRRGPFVYRPSFSVMRQKAVHVAGLVAALVLAGALDAMSALGKLRGEQAELDAQLKVASSELFGEARDAKTITSDLGKGMKEEKSPLPKATAYDLLDQLSKKMPPADRIKLDVLELEIRPKKTFIKGTVDSAAAVDEIAGKLKEIDCVDEVTKGAVTEVSGGAKQFTLNLNTRCP